MDSGFAQNLHKNIQNNDIISHNIKIIYCPEMPIFRILSDIKAIK
jgi:hypothetical protein